MTIATRILAHRGRLAAEGRVAALVGSEAVYLGGRAASPATMTPYDVAAVRLADGLELAGSPPPDVERYLTALRGGSAGAVALVEGAMVSAADLAALVALVTGDPWPVAEASAGAAGALVGVHAHEEG